MTGNTITIKEWQELMAEADQLAERTGWGLAGTWGLIHAGDYPAARERLDQLQAMLRDVQRARR